MQKLTLLSILIISGVLGTTLVWSQLAFVQATSNESGTIQCITIPCDYPSPNRYLCHLSQIATMIQ